MISDNYKIYLSSYIRKTFEKDQITRVGRRILFVKPGNSVRIII